MAPFILFINYIIQKKMKKIKITIVLILFTQFAINTHAQWDELIGSKALSALQIPIGTICSDKFGNIYAASRNNSGNYYVAKFDGTSWSELGGINSLKANSVISSICTDNKGNVYAAGRFTNKTSVDSGFCYVAKFDGNSWSELGGNNQSIFKGEIYTIYSDKSGNIYAGGGFRNTMGNYYVAKFNGISWSELGGNNSLKANFYIFSIISDPSGNIYTAGNFTNGSTNSMGNRYVAKFDGNTWSELGGNNSLKANGSILSICSDQFGNIYTAGFFNKTSNNYYVAKYNGSVWAELVGFGQFSQLKANGEIRSICSDASGNIYAAGSFKNINGNYYVSKFDGTSWSELGGVNSMKANGFILSIFNDELGNVYCAGNFYVNSKQFANRYIAKYNGFIWFELGGTFELGANEAILSICKDKDGNIYAAGHFNKSNKLYVSKFNNNVWTTLGEFNTAPNAIPGSSYITSLCIDGSNNLYAAINHTGNCYVAKFDGNNWSELGGANSLKADVITSICNDKYGNIYAAGWIKNSNDNYYVAKYDGTTWSELGGTNALKANQGINSICVDALGNIYAAGLFTNSSNKHYVAKFNGTAWSEIGGLNGLAANNDINTLCVDILGNIYAAGRFINKSNNLYVAKFDGNKWSEISSNGLNAHVGWGGIRTICVDKSGNIYAAGDLKNGPSLNDFYFVAKFDGNLWSELGGDNSLKANSSIFTIYSDEFNNIYAAGDFTNGVNNTAGKKIISKFTNKSTSIKNHYLVNKTSNLYPNPTQNQTTLITNSQFVGLNYYIYNRLGQLILSEKIYNEEITINLNSLPKGYYILSIGDIQNEKIKFIKE